MVKCTMNRCRGAKKFFNDRVLIDKFYLFLPLELSALMTSNSAWNLFA